MALLPALLEADARRPPGAPRVRLVLAGRRSAEDDALLAGGGELVRHLGMLDRPAALALQRAADALLLLTGLNPSEATGKLFEYLAAGRPILAVAHGNEAARVIQETRTGVTVAPGDHAGLVAALRELALGRLGGSYAPRDLERFTYPGPARELAALAEEAITRRAAAG
jgi:glycosyltransferase involved in cell wall biosynthesis